jgi:hypothetical protein
LPDRPESRPPRPPPPSGLDEVERALSVLDGRHPDHERTRRETMAAAEQRRRVLQGELAARSRRRRRRAASLFLATVALIAAVVVAWRTVGRAKTLRGALQKEEAPFVSRGAQEIASNELSGSHTLEADLPASSCFIAVSTAGMVRVRAGETSMEAARSAGWCACAAGHATVEATAEGEAVGMAVLRVDARRLGGPLARPWAELTPTAWGPGGSECADATLDGWLADRRWPAAPLDARWLEGSPRRATLGRAGFRVVSGVEPGRPFGVVESAAGDCTLAIAAGDDVLSLRATGGQRLVSRAQGALAWCASAAAMTTVWREGASSVIILSGPAARLGGVLGARECAETAGVHLASDAIWLRDEDLAWDATSVLQASGLSGITSAELPAAPAAATSDVMALALSPSARVASEPASATVACDPPLRSPPDQRASVCVAAAPVSFWRTTDARTAAAHAPLPLWLSLLASHHEPDAVARLPELLTLVRRLVREGFEPTVLEGVTELQDGVRVVGRAGEDQIVAVGLGPRPPWVFPYTDGVPWDLGDAPRVITLQPGSAVKLASTPPSNAPLEKRRTIVFRHAARR